ncbi:glycosyltransferase family 4 protein [Salibacter halophilus]|uniref:Glycosyltransferase family 4 protein n=2 Tax=Salibacter halophilus TaxID=1803916 RepID=A0A6N6MBA8_9FLAO|nr:glycosyltransferase [Salibacter halophilus]KAB1065711.1 glycosyltransferase family 4 protein [Salibacter halophilus]
MEKDVTIEGVQIHGVRKPSSRIDRIFKLSKDCYQRAVEINSQLYHIHDPELLPIALKLKKLGKLVIYDAHENTPASIIDKEWIPFQFVRNFVSKVFEKYELNVSKQLDAVISVAEPLLERYIQNEKVLIRNLPILDNFKGEELSPEMQKAEKGAVYAGGLTSARNIKEMIDAVGKSYQIKVLHLFGEWESKDYMTICKRSKGWSKVCYWGFKDSKQVYTFLKEKGLIGLILFDKDIKNHKIALPNKAFEYMAAGLPILMSDIAYWKENFHSVAKFTDPSDSEKISKSIDDMISDQKQLSERVEKGLREVNMLNWQKESQVLIDLYRRLINT